MQQAPILFIDADDDDQLIFKEALQKLAIPNPVLFFTGGQAALDYLATTADLPFLIFSEINMPGMNGLELRQQIEQDRQLRKKAIPFLFFTYPVIDSLVEEAYELTIQGFFEKKTSVQGWENQLRGIFAYWTECHHPKRFATK